MNAFLETHGSNSRNFRSNLDATVAWTGMLSLAEPECDNIPLELIDRMLQHDSKSRPDAETVFHTIRYRQSISAPQVDFIGICCLDDDESSGDIVDYEGDTLMT